MNPAISPQQNAAKYYKDYQKAKTAEKVLTEQIAKGETELSYLAERAWTSWLAHESERDIAGDPAGAGRGRISSGDTQGKEADEAARASRPMRFRSTDGFDILGRPQQPAERPADAASMAAKRRPLAAHAEDPREPCDRRETNGQQPSDETVTEAMMLAAYYSQARGGQNVPVDYTPVKSVKKPAGAKPGMVIYDRYQTGRGHAGRGAGGAAAGGTKMNEERHYAFFQNRECEFFPCHNGRGCGKLQLPVLLLSALRPRAEVRREFSLHGKGHQGLHELPIPAQTGEL